MVDFVIFPVVPWCLSNILKLIKFFNYYAFCNLSIYFIYCLGIFKIGLWFDCNVFNNFPWIFGYLYGVLYVIFLILICFFHISHIDVFFLLPSILKFCFIKKYTLNLPASKLSMEMIRKQLVRGRMIELQSKTLADCVRWLRIEIGIVYL